MMNINDLEVIITQEIGIQVSNQGDYLIGHWKLDNGELLGIIFYHDEELKLTYITARLPELDKKGNILNTQLLKENLKIPLVKFCLDKESRVMVLSEIRDDMLTGEHVKRALYSLVKATGKYLKL